MRIDPREIADFEYRDGALYALMVTEQVGVEREEFGGSPYGFWVWPVKVAVIRQSTEFERYAQLYADRECTEKAIQAKASGAALAAELAKQTRLMRETNQELRDLGKRIRRLDEGN